jgi:hypothetical protein
MACRSRTLCRCFQCLQSISHVPKTRDVSLLLTPRPLVDPGLAAGPQSSHSSTPPSCQTCPYPASSLLPALSAASLPSSQSFTALGRPTTASYQRSRRGEHVLALVWQGGWSPRPQDVEVVVHVQLTITPLSQEGFPSKFLKMESSARAFE